MFLQAHKAVFFCACSGERSKRRWHFRKAIIPNEIPLGKRPGLDSGPLERVQAGLSLDVCLGDELIAVLTCVPGNATEAALRAGGVPAQAAYFQEEDSPSGSK